MKDNSSAFNSAIYDSKVNAVLPYYTEYNRQILDLAEVLGIKCSKWLDTGCGTGNLARQIVEKISDVKLVLCDPSAEMLETAKSKLCGFDNMEFRNISSQELDYDGEFDIVTAVQAHHYLSEDERRKAVKNCYDALKIGGIFITFENIALSSEQSEKLAISRWKNYMLAHGRTEEQTENHMKRRGTELFPIKIEEHIKLLKEIGFTSVDLLWSSYLQAGFFAIKQNN